MPKANKTKHSPELEKGWKAGMLEAEALLKRREGELKQHILNVLEAIDKVEAAGCLDHLDCWDESEEEWDKPIAMAKAAALGKEYKPEEEDEEEDEDEDEEEEYYEEDADSN
jgi:hypothetical protein